MHELAREHIGAHAASVTFATRDFRARDWPIGLGVFDAIVTMQAAHETRHRRHLVPLLERARSALADDGVLLYCDHYAAASMNPSLYVERTEQPTALRAAGFATIELLHDEGGMALYSARVRRARAPETL
jgi:hypothetical protein